MNSELFSVKTFISVLSIVIGLKIFKWLSNYIYQVWIYSHINGPPIVPFFGNFLSLNSSKSGGFNYFLNF